MVEEYMTRQFTFESDRLIALAGIASVYQRLTEIPEESYLAGLWRHTFLQDLLWVTREGSRVCPPQLYRAPTWSWASMEPRDQTDRFSWGYVEATPSGADINPNHLVATVKAVEVETPGSRFGLVSSAHIVLQSYLIKACLSTEIKNVPSYFTDEQVAEFFTGGRREYAVNTLALFADDDLTTFPPEAMSVEDSLESLMKPVLDDTLLPFSIPKKMAVYLAIIECFLDHAKRGDGHALVLVKGSQKGEYRRIGYVRLKQKVMYPWTTHGHFGAFEALDPSEYLQKGAEAGSYAYRVV
ncbi:hypothetical protein QQZ08_003726 [Neonectria magnoliae]|uniref:Uncharacterized protein n=1 Tax=Neonectria magnoliae TaxID=2732573 RepID=A0ABR1I898_9HYPO